MPRRTHPRQLKHKPRGKQRPQGWHKRNGSPGMREASRWLDEERRR